MRISVISLLILPLLTGETAALPKIVGGMTVSNPPSQFPFFALIATTSSDDKNALSMHCGGAQIHERFVLSALHCFLDDKWEHGHYSVYFNTRNRCNIRQHGTQYGIKHVYKTSKSKYEIDQDTNEIVLIDDIAIIELKEPRKLSVYPSLPNADPSGSGFAIGYGLVSNYNKHSAACRMQKTYSEFVISTKECAKLSDKVMEHVEGNFCVKSTQNTAACNGDSGGPWLQEDYDGGWIVTGLTSFGPTFCDAKSSFDSFTNVYHYLDWIEGIVWA